MSIKNILVTGGAGFIASHLIKKLVIQYENYHIINFDKLDYCSSLKYIIERNHKNYTFIKGDITDSVDFVNYILTKYEIDTIIHCAAQSHVDNSFGDSFEFTKNNILGTHVLLEAARIHKIKKFIHVSTDEVYGQVNYNQPTSKENSTLQPSNPYSATKAAAEQLVNAYNKSFGLPSIITRSNNVYGPHQYPEKVVPKFICSLLKGKRCFIHGDGSNSRHYLYCSDVVDAFDVILHKGVVGEIYNIGGKFEVSNLYLAKYLIDKFGLLVGGSSSKDDYSSFLEFVSDRPFNDKRYAIDSAKVESLGWSPKVSFEDGIEKTIAWYKENLDTWWENDDLSNVLVAHPSKRLPRYDLK